MDVAKHSESTTETYLYLRVGLVALAVFLGASLVIELAFGDSPWLGSISAYYYTPVRSVFVGTLSAMGVCLIAIKGRDRPREDLMLNLAGMCAPVVALVPTPLEDAACGAETRCVPESYVPAASRTTSRRCWSSAPSGCCSRHGRSAAAPRSARTWSASAPPRSAWSASRCGSSSAETSFLDFAHYGDRGPDVRAHRRRRVRERRPQVDEFVQDGGTLSMISTADTPGRPTAASPTHGLC